MNRPIQNQVNPIPEMTIKEKSVYYSLLILSVCTVIQATKWISEKSPLAALVLMSSYALSDRYLNSAIARLSKNIVNQLPNFPAAITDRAMAAIGNAEIQERPPLVGNKPSYQATV